MRSARASRTPVTYYTVETWLLRRIQLARRQNSVVIELRVTVPPEARNRSPSSDGLAIES
jgi:hypothetical protein